MSILLEPTLTIPSIIPFCMTWSSLMVLQSLMPPICLLRTYITLWIWMDTNLELLGGSWSTARQPTLSQLLMLQLSDETYGCTKGRQPQDVTSLLEGRLYHISDILLNKLKNPIMFKLMSMLLLKLFPTSLPSLCGCLIPSRSEILLLLQSSTVWRLLPISMVRRNQVPLNMLFALMLSMGIDYGKKR